MAVFKCKMCGGALEISTETVTTCDYCGTQQTVPTAKDENLQGLFNRANVLRMKNEFDKAEQIFEKILQADETQAEAYWGLILCKYGIEYVEDPKTYARIPTCHRTSYDSIIADEDYKSALQYADAVQRGLYEAEAKEIDRLQKEILAISQKEEPYDVFICYKETDETGKRTQDSVIANDIYYQLTQEGFKVFYAAITLEDKLGSAYEPCIFAALHSAKVMLAIGTKAEHFNAIWVKNEWGRFLKMMKTDRNKTLIPCYKDMDAYDLPEEFAHLQAQDMSKIGFINDVVRGIKKLIQVDEPKATVIKETVVTESNTNTAPLLKRAFIFLEDGDWNSANEYCEKVLDLDPECAEAYLGKLMAELKVKTQKSLKDCAEPFDDRNNYQKTIRFANEELKTTLTAYVEYIKTRNENARLEGIYAQGKAEMKSARTEIAFKAAAKLFAQIPEYLDSSELEKKCLEEAEIKRKNEILALGKGKMWGHYSHYEKAIRIFESIPGWKDADEKILECRKAIEEIKAKEENERLEKERQEEQRIAKLETIRQKQKKVQGFISAAGYCTVGLKADGLVVTTKYTGPHFTGPFNVSDWKDIVAISGASHHAVGLKADGTVVATKYAGKQDYTGQCDVSKWTGIVAISAGYHHTVGLKADGTVVATKYTGPKAFYHGECDVSEWTDIVAISAGIWHTAGLKADGTVVTVGGNKVGQCDVSEWTDIVAISTSSSCTVGLKADGTVVATKYTGKQEDYHGECDVSEWTDIVAVSAGAYHTVGLKADGTVVTTKYIGKYYENQCEVSKWTGIVAISSSGNSTVGLKADGTVVAVGGNKFDECNVSDWKLFQNFDSLEEERELARQQQRQRQQRRETGLCQHCGGTLKGLFTKKCVNCGKPKDY